MPSKELVLELVGQTDGSDRNRLVVVVDQILGRLPLGRGDLGITSAAATGVEVAVVLAGPDSGLGDDVLVLALASLSAYVGDVASA